MSSRAFLIAILVAAAVASALAAEYVVGDGAGWTLGLNYTDWAKRNDFRVGDTLKFSYTIGEHNVLEVSRADAEGCTSSDASAFPLMTGNDVVILDSPGEKWYICDVGDHCLKGMMKLGITVQPPATVMVSSHGPLRSCEWMLLVMAAYYWINIII